MATAFTIERDVPMPTGDGRGRPTTYPFGSMLVGDSFTVGEERGRSAVRAAYLYGSRHGLTFTVRKLESGNYRIWRAA
jgi:hypothetical protein